MNLSCILSDGSDFILEFLQSYKRRFSVNIDDWTGVEVCRGSPPAIYSVYSISIVSRSLEDGKKLRGCPSSRVRFIGFRGILFKNEVANRNAVREIQAT